MAEETPTVQQAVTVIEVGNSNAYQGAVKVPIFPGAALVPNHHYTPEELMIINSRPRYVGRENSKSNEESEEGEGFQADGECSQTD